MMDKDFDVVLMTGLPGSGKTTFCRERLFPSHLYISLDQLRTRSAEAELFAFALRRRKSCVIDNTNVSALERARYITSDSKKTSCIYEDTYWGLTPKTKYSTLFIRWESLKIPCIILALSAKKSGSETGTPCLIAARGAGARVVSYFFEPDLDSCLARNAGRVGKAHVPEVAIKCKLAKFEPPDFGEGIDEIYDVKVFENGFDVRRRNEKE